MPNTSRGRSQCNATQRKLYFWLALAAVLTTAGAGVLYYLYVWPWVAPPPESREAIAARWAKVQRWAAFDAACAKGVLDPGVAAEGLEHDALYSRYFARDGYPRLSRTDLPPSLQEAFEHLATWAENHGGLSAKAHDPGAASRGLLRLAQFALATTTNIEDPLVSTVAVTGRTLRRCGNFIQVVGGFEVARALVQWSRDRAVGGSARLRASQPTRDELFVALARDAIDVEALSKTGYASAPSASSAPWYLVSFVSLERELDWLRYTAAERLIEVDARRRDPVVMLALYKDDPEALPHSLLVRGTTPYAEGSLRRATETIEQYSTVLGSP